VYDTTYPIAGSATREMEAQAATKELDQRYWLDPEESMVERKSKLTATLTSSPDTFIHINRKQHLNDLILQEDQKRVQNTIARIVLECLYHKMGFTLEYKQWDDERRRNKGKEKLKDGEDGAEEVKPWNPIAEQFHLLNRAADQIGIDPHNIPFLVGKLSNWTA
jgi:hypothetical protein